MDSSSSALKILQPAPKMHKPDFLVNIKALAGSAVCFETYGCSANEADTEAMKHYVTTAGLTLSDKADTVVVNTCAVKGPTQSSFERRIKDLEAQGKKIIITGCLARSMPNHPLIINKPALGPDHPEKIIDAISAAHSGIRYKAITIKAEPRLTLASEIDPNRPYVIAISQGCLSSCSFCMTKLARGNLRSYRPREILAKAKHALDLGATEIYLTSQDTSAYGRDIGLNLVDLLSQLLELPYKFRLRIGMANPEHFKLFSKNLWPLFNSKKLYRFLHIPVQSGSDLVLGDMRRDHNSQDFIELVSEARGRFPDMTIATDIICGYPTETDRCHEATLNLLHKTRPDAVNISKFWPRPGTRAARLKPLNGKIVQRRSKEVTDKFKQIALSRNRSWLGWSGEVFHSEISRRGQVLGRNLSYKQIIINGTAKDKFNFGNIEKVKIKDYGKFELSAEVI